MAFGGLKGTLKAAANSITNPIDATGSVSVAIGDLIFGVIGEQTGLTSTGVTDNLGNTYTATNAGTDAGTSTARAFYSYATVAGTLTAVHFAATASAHNVAVVAAVIEGPFVTSPLDANPANITSDITSPYTCPATGTLAQANEVVIAWGVATGSTVWAATSPNLLADQQATAAVLHTVIGYQAVTATTDISPVFTAASDPSDAVLGTSSFKGLLQGTLSQTLGDVTLAGTGTVIVAADLGKTLEAATLAATGTVVGEINGVVDVTLGAATLAAEGTVTVVGDFNKTLSDITLAGTGTVTVQADLTKTLGTATLVATGTVEGGGGNPTSFQISKDACRVSVTACIVSVEGGGYKYF